MEHYFDFVSHGFDLTPVITHRLPSTAGTKRCWR
jgi:hypothetical protein